MHNLTQRQISKAVPAGLLPERQLRPGQTVRGAVAVRAKKAAAPSSNAKGKQVTYGSDWYSATRQASKPFRTVREEIGKLS